MCGNRYVLFDNKTKDELKKAEQLKELLSLVNAVVDNNGGKPYTDELFFELKVSVFFTPLCCSPWKMLMVKLKFIMPLLFLNRREH